MSMVHISYGMKEPVSADLRSECAILAGMAQATLPASSTPWQWYAEDYDRIRDTMAQVLDGFEDFNTRVRHPHGFRLSQPARDRGFLTSSGRAEFGLAPLPGDTDPAEGRLMLATVRSHDQFNTTIYSNDDRYRGLKGLRTVVFMNSGDMQDRGLDEFDLVDITSFSRDGSRRTVYGYRAIRYEIPRGGAAGYMPELVVAAWTSIQVTRLLPARSVSPAPPKAKIDLPERAVVRRPQPGRPHLKRDAVSVSRPRARARRRFRSAVHPARPERLPPARFVPAAAGRAAGPLASALSSRSA